MTILRIVNNDEVAPCKHRWRHDELRDVWFCVFCRHIEPVDDTPHAA